MNSGGDGAGHTRVYRWNGTAWLQLGSDFDGVCPSLPRRCFSFDCRSSSILAPPLPLEFLVPLGEPVASKSTSMMTK